MFQTLLLLLKFLPLVLEIVRMIQARRLSAQATEEMLADLEMTADYLVNRSNLAREQVKDTPDEVAKDPLNRDNW